MISGAMYSLVPQKVLAYPSRGGWGRGEKENDKSRRTGVSCHLKGGGFVCSQTTLHYHGAPAFRGSAHPTHARSPTAFLPPLLPFPATDFDRLGKDGALHEFLGEAKVGQADVPHVIHEHVLQFEVAVYHWRQTTGDQPRGERWRGG